MKIGTRITSKKILEALPCIEKDHGNNALRVAKLIKKLCQKAPAEEVYVLLKQHEDLFSDDHLRFKRKFERERIQDHLGYKSYFLTHFYPPEMWYSMVIDYIDVLLHTHGVEGLSSEDHSCTKSVAIYCNAGDTYATTIYWDNIKQGFYIGCWGDLVEHYQNTEGWTF